MLFERDWIAQLILLLFWTLHIILKKIFKFLVLATKNQLILWINLTLKQNIINIISLFLRYRESTILFVGCVVLLVAFAILLPWGSERHKLQTKGGFTEDLPFLHESRTRILLNTM